MKKFSHQLRAAALTAMLIGTTSTALAYNFKVNGIYYNINATTATATVTHGNYDSYTGGSYSGSVTIPPTVTCNGATYFVTGIGEYAFYKCPQLTSISLSEYITNIGNSAFAYCDNLTQITIPSSVTNIGNNAFQYCDNLSSIVVNSGNTVYDSRNSCNAIIVTSTNKLRFGCKNTVIPNTVTSIDSWAFGRRKGLTSMTIPNSVTSIGWGAFYGCPDLVSVTVPGSVTNLDGGVFSNCTKLKYITLGNGLTQISASMFSGCESLTSITIPSTVTSIRYWAFEACRGLTSISIPPSVTEIEVAAFKACTGLTSMSVQNGNTVYDSRNGCNGIIETATNTLVAGCRNTVIPSSVTTISYAFIGFDNITSIVIPNSVTRIGEQAFSYCSNLTDVTMSNAITRIEDFAFLGCVNLKSIEIPASVQYIGWAALACGQTDIDADVFKKEPATEGDRPQYNRHDDNRHDSPMLAATNAEEMPGLAHIYSRIVDPTSVSLYGLSGYESFYEPSYATCILHVPTGTVEAYKAADVWKKFACITDKEVPVVEEIILDKTSVALFVGDTVTISATVEPFFVENPGIQWSTINPDVATVDQNGLVTAVNLGLTTIMATATDGSGTTARCIVNVVKLDTDNYFTMHGGEVLHGTTMVIPVSLTNATSITAFQTDLVLPTGFELARQDGDYLVGLSDRAASDHIIMASDADNGAIRLLCYSPSLKPFSGNEGELFYITVIAPDDGDGTYFIDLMGSRMTTTECEELLCQDAECEVFVKAYIDGDANNSGTITIADVVTTARYILDMNPIPFVFGAADINGDGKITITDVVLIARAVLAAGLHAPSPMTSQSGAADVMSAQPMTIENGQTQTVTINLDNALNYTAWQFDLRLPDGLTATNLALTSRAGRHTLDASVIENGIIRVLAYSTSLSSIDGHEGAVMTFDVTASGDIDGDITVDGIELVTPQGQTTYPAPFTIQTSHRTAVQEAMAGARVYSDGHNIIIEAPTAMTVVVSDILGHATSIKVEAGKTAIPTLHDGIHIVTADGKTTKLITK